MDTFMTFRIALFLRIPLVFSLAVLLATLAAHAEDRVVDASTIQGHVMCGYQGWFRCPHDAADMGWDHWSRDSSKLTPQTLTFEMWPDLTDFPMSERFAAPGFTHKDGSQAYLFSSDN